MGKRAGGHHAIYFDGRAVHDPAGEARPLGDYEIVEVLMIVKDASHPRWNQKIEVRE